MKLGIGSPFSPTRDEDDEIDYDPRRMRLSRPEPLRFDLAVPSPVPARSSAFSDIDDDDDTSEYFEEVPSHEYELAADLLASGMMDVENPSVRKRR